MDPFDSLRAGLFGPQRRGLLDDNRE